MQLYLDTLFHASFVLLMRCAFYRSPLANTIHPTDVNDLANHLVIVCRRATETFLTIAGTIFFIHFIFIIFINKHGNHVNYSIIHVEKMELP
jgi:hypothetical protein